MARPHQFRLGRMTTVLDANVFNIAVKGTFDDCQNIVKELFNDLSFKEKYALGAVNSINWARVLAQVVYYFYAWFRVTDGKNIPITFSVPTGNFGDIFAGFVAKRMGLPISKLCWPPMKIIFSHASSMTEITQRVGWSNCFPIHGHSGGIQF